MMEILRSTHSQADYVYTVHLLDFHKNLGRYKLAQYLQISSAQTRAILGNLVEKKLLGANLKELLPSIKASGQLPHGIVGEAIYKNLSDGVENCVKKTAPYLSDKLLEPINVDIKIADFNLIGRIDSIYPERMVQFRYAKVKAKDHLKQAPSYGVHSYGVNFI